MYIAYLYRIIGKFWKTKFRLIIYRYIKIILNLTYPIYIVFNRTRKTNSNSIVVVSLTSFPERIKSVGIAIETLLRQTYPPKEIVLWLADDQFPNRKVPRKLRQLEKYGLSIRFCEDLRSHKKYYYSMLDYCSECIVTVDDDTFYPENLLEVLYNAYQEHPNCIITSLAHKIMLSAEGNILPYEQWEKMVDGNFEESYLFLPIGCEGVLYPPKSLHHNVFNKEWFMEHCKSADDLWLKAMSLLNLKRVYIAFPSPITFIGILGSQKISLGKINNNLRKNNEQLFAILKQYPEILLILK